VEEVVRLDGTIGKGKGVERLNRFIFGNLLLPQHTGLRIKAGRQLGRIKVSKKAGRGICLKIFFANRGASAGPKRQV